MVKNANVVIDENTDSNFVKSVKEVVAKIFHIDYEKNCDYAIHLKKCNYTLKYTNVDGFFIFRGTIFYKNSSSTGRSITTGESFTKVIKNLYPEEFGNLIGKDIAEIEVIPLETV